MEHDIRIMAVGTHHKCGTVRMGGVFRTRPRSWSDADDT
jgi:hypothetical protein